MFILQATPTITFVRIQSFVFIVLSAVMCLLLFLSGGDTGGADEEHVSLWPHRAQQREPPFILHTVCTGFRLQADRGK